MRYRNASPYACKSAASRVLRALRLTPGDERRSGSAAEVRLDAAPSDRGCMTASVSAAQSVTHQQQRGRHSDVQMATHVVGQVLLWKLLAEPMPTQHVQDTEASGRSMMLPCCTFTALQLFLRRAVGTWR